MKRRAIVRRGQTLLLFATMLVGLLGMVGLSHPEAVSASTPGCATLNGWGPWTRDWTYGSGYSAVNRQGCFSVGLYQSGNDYWWSAQAMDTIDACVGGWSDCHDIDSGEMWVEYKTPGTNDWHAWCHDQNSSDYYLSQCTLPNAPTQFNVITNGPPSAWAWRYHLSLNRWTSTTGWRWYDQYGNGFAETF